MGLGILVPNAGTRLPSQHFAAHFPGASRALRTFVAGLIDGEVAALAEPLDVVPGQANGSFAQFAVVDVRVGEVRAFAIALLARTAAQLAQSPTPIDPRPTPTLLGDFHQGANWDAYNCYIVDFTVWSRDSIYDNKWPKVATR